MRAALRSLVATSALLTLTPQTDDFASGNQITAVGGTAEANLDPASAYDNVYTVHYFISVTINAHATQYGTATLVVAIETNDGGGGGWVERTAVSYNCSYLSGPPPYAARTCPSWSHEQTAVTVAGLGLNDDIRLRAKSFSTTNGAGGSFKIRGGDAGGSNPEAYNGVTYMTGVPLAPQVTPDGSARLVATTSGGVLSFSVSNPNSLQRTYTLSATCNGVVTSCGTPSPASVALAAGQSTGATVTVSTGGIGLATGTLSLTATDQSMPSVLDAGSYTLTLAPSGPAIARDLCLTIAAGAGAAYECGDLRLVHALPAVRTLNKTRAPVLLYNSQHARPYQLFSADVTVPTPLPTTVRAVLWINGTRRDSTDWAGSTWVTGGQTRRIVLKWAPPPDSTKPYDYRIELKRITGGSVDSLPSVLGQFIVVSRQNSPFGPGWWLAGYEQLDSVPGLPGQRLWVGGDGSAAIYQRGGQIGNDTAYLAPVIDRPDTLLHTASNEWKRLLRGGDTVVFASSGVHIRTANRLGYRTLFTDSSGFLVRMEVPGDSSLKYRFTYAGSPARLTQVTIPDSASGTYRVTGLVWAGDSVRITDPGTTAPVTFRYQAGGANRMQSRTTRRGAVTRFVYNAGFRLDSVKVGLGGSDSINVSFCGAEVRGLAACSPNILAPESVYTRFNGPRVLPDSDIVDFWVDSRGTPGKVRDPYGVVTTLTRGDLAGSSLVTRVQYPNGRITGATYDARGNLATSTDSSLYTSGIHATTRYQWDQRWDNVTEMIAPTSEVMHFGYDAANGNRLWQEDGRGAPSRVTFAYYTSGNGTGLVKTVTDPTGAKDSVAYDVRGNLAYSRTPLGYVTTSTLDRLGRPRVVVSPVSGVTRDDSTSYDQRGLPLRTVAFGRAVNGVANQRVIVQSFYNVEGQLDSLQRSTIPDSASVGTITTRWHHDLAGRAVAEIAPDLQRDSTRYDQAGNVTATVTRRGDTLTMVYDALNRLRQRITRAYIYPKRDSVGIATVALAGGFQRPYPWFPSDSIDWTLTIPGDTALFTYDSVGNLTRADNADAKVRRTYYKNGLVQTDTLKIRTWYGTDTTRHVYGVGYRYDLSGRLVALGHPGQMAPAVGADTARQEYDVTTGLLSAVVDPLGNRFEYTYNLRNQPFRLALPGGIVDTTAYDADSRLSLEKILNRSQSLYKRTDSVFQRVTVTYADPVRVAVATNTAGYQETDSSWYGGLGALVHNKYTAPVNSNWGLPGGATEEETFGLDGLGNRYSSSHVSTLASSILWQTSGSTHAYRLGPLSGLAATGRLRAVAHANSNPNQDRVDTTLYDASGNTVFSYQSAANSLARLEDHASFYGADSRLRVAEYRWVQRSSSPCCETWPWQLAIDEYRYDALGRRVLARTRRECSLDFTGGHHIYACSWGSIRRTVWAGDRELYEIQQLANLGIYQEAAIDTMENDTQAIRMGVGATPAFFDLGRQFGSIAYTYGPEIDQPLSAIRIDYVDTLPGQPRVYWGPITVVPHWNWRGRAEYGTVADGGVKVCQSGGTRCASPAWRVQPFAFAQQPADTASAWYGTLLRDKEDGTATLYRRNRYVDPGTGRFTQEDPIGLAGGLNLYGFAGGDPLNLSDPFGLCHSVTDPKEKKECKLREPSKAENEELDTLERDLAKSDDTMCRQAGAVLSELRSQGRVQFFDQALHTRRGKLLGGDADQRPTGPVHLYSGRSSVWAPWYTEMQLRNSAVHEVGHTMNMDEPEATAFGNKCTHTQRAAS